MKRMVQVHVFKTNVSSKKAIQSLKFSLNKLISTGRWNFDLEDCDNILRVESNSLTPQQIIELLESENFKCIELE